MCDSSKIDDSQNLWHGSINTSTDTLVPLVETKIQNGNCDITDGSGGSSTTASPHKKQQEHKDSTTTTANALNAQNQIIGEKTKISASTNCNILPKVHSTTNNVTPRPNQLSTNSNNNMILVATQATSSFASQDDSINSSHNSCDSKATTTATATSRAAGGVDICGAGGGCMEESILILPEHRKLEISISGKCETIAANTTTSSSGSSMVSTTTTTQLHSQSTNTTTTTPATANNISSASVAAATALPCSSAAATPTCSSMSGYNLPYATATTPFTCNSAIPNTTTAASSQRRRRTSSSNSGFVAKQVNGRLVFPKHFDLKISILSLVVVVVL